TSAFAPPTARATSASTVWRATTRSGRSSAAPKRRLSIAPSQASSDTRWRKRPRMFIEGRTRNSIGGTAHGTSLAKKLSEPIDRAVLWAEQRGGDEHRAQAKNDRRTAREARVITEQD